MHTSHANTCPLLTQVSNISHELLPVEHTPPIHQPETTHTHPTQQDGTLLLLELLDPNFNRSQSPHHVHSPLHHESPSHSLHAHSFVYPPQPSSGNGTARTNMEWSLIRPFQRRDGELCLHPSSPMGGHGMELGDANSKLANAARITTPTQSLSHASNLCTSTPVNAPLSSPSEASKSPISQVEKHSGEFLQRGLTSITSRSHFSVPQSKRNKSSTEGR